MPTIAPERPETAFKPGYRGFLAFAAAIGETLPPYMRRIAKAFFESPELAVIMPKGNGKTHTAALLGLHHLLVTENAEVRIVAIPVLRTMQAAETARMDRARMRVPPSLGSCARLLDSYLAAVWRSTDRPGPCSPVRRTHSRTHGPVSGTRRAAFYTEFDGRRPKRLVIKVLGQ